MPCCDHVSRYYLEAFLLSFYCVNFFIRILLSLFNFLCAYACDLCRPETFRSASPEVLDEVPSSCDLLQGDNEVDSSDDDGLPPLEANMNRTRPAEFQSDADSDSDATP